MDSDSRIPVVEGEENVFNATQVFIRALETNKNLTSSMKKILEDLNMQLSAMNVGPGNRLDLSITKQQLVSAEEKIMKWESDQSRIWECVPEAGSEYLQAVDEVRKLAESLGSLSIDEDKNVSELLSRAQRVLQMAMARLEEEFSSILFQNRQCFEPEHMSFRSDEPVEDYSFNSVESESPGTSMRRDSSSKISEESVIDLVHPDVVPDLKCIANMMFACNYDQECLQAYISTRKNALDECLYVLQMEKISIDDVMKMDWCSLNIAMKKWMRAMKIFTRVYLSSEKRVCEQIFEDLGTNSSVCFVQTSKPSVFQLLSFSEAIAVGPHSPEKLFRILDMYETLSGLLPDIDILFSDEVGAIIRTEYQEALKRLGDSVIWTFSEFEKAVGSNTSTAPFAGGGIHHLTKYVMNYIKFLTDYSYTLNDLLQSHNAEESVLVLPKLNPIDEENEGESSSCCASPFARRLQRVTSVLESNLKSKSTLYKDAAIQHFFLMNNICYMVHKIKGSELRQFFGDDWIRQHNWKFQQDAMNYERATWSSILSFLKEDGIYHPGSNSVSKTILKERFRNFNAAFEEVYRNQTGWLIHDPQLRDDLRISVSLKVIQAYRTFLGRHANQLDSERHSERYIKYSADDLQNHLLDFFEGSPKSLHFTRRR